MSNCVVPLLAIEEIQKIYNIPHKHGAAPLCHPERKHSGRGLCLPCYTRIRSLTEKRRRQLEGWRRQYTKEQIRKWRLKYTYQITKEQDLALMRIQGRKCGICQHPLPKKFAIDHDHSCCGKRKSCGKCVRGFLCFRCNTFLGVLENDPNMYEKTLSYLQKPPFQKVLHA